MHFAVYGNEIDKEKDGSRILDYNLRIFLNFAKKDWIYEVTNDDFGVILERYYKKEQNLEELFLKLKNEYDLLYKEYEIGKSNKHNTWIIAIIGVVAVINIINLLMFFGK